MSDAIKSMKLYSQVERIHNDLASVGVGRTDPVTVDVLAQFDQLHYFGTQAVDDAIAVLEPVEGARILDIGAGFGGPARYLADRARCHVTAIELQADLDAAATELTARCGLADRVAHVCGDIHAVPLEAQAYDGAISYLALYHIPDRAAVYAKLHDALKPGGRAYVEDLYARQPMTAAEDETMRHSLFANTVTDRDGYVVELEAAGFTDIDFQDHSTRWGGFCAERLAGFRSVREQKISTHGAEVVAALDAFYQTMCDLFDGGNLGGVRVSAKRA
jgi:SAM-dependent methyltransferase